MEFFLDQKTGVASPSDFTKPFLVGRLARYLPFVSALECGMESQSCIVVVKVYVWCQGEPFVLMGGRHELVFFCFKNSNTA